MKGNPVLNGPVSLLLPQRIVTTLHGVTSQTIPVINLETSHLRMESSFLPKAIPVTGRGGPYGSKLPHVLDSRLTVGGEAAFRVDRLPLQEDSWYLFLLEAESTPGT
jgi:hypothetical protein